MTDLFAAASTLVDEWDAAMAGDVPLNGHYQKQALDRLRAAVLADAGYSLVPKEDLASLRAVARDVADALDRYSRETGYVGISAWADALRAALEETP